MMMMHSNIQLHFSYSPREESSVASQSLLARPDGDADKGLQKSDWHSEPIKIKISHKKKDSLKFWTPNAFKTYIWKKQKLKWWLVEQESLKLHHSKKFGYLLRTGPPAIYIYIENCTFFLLLSKSFALICGHLNVKSICPNNFSKKWIHISRPVKASQNVWNSILGEFHQNWIKMRPFLVVLKQRWYLLGYF